MPTRQITCNIRGHYACPTLQMFQDVSATGGNSHDNPTLKFGQVHLTSKIVKIILIQFSHLLAMSDCENTMLTNGNGDGEASLLC